MAAPGPVPDPISRANIDPNFEHRIRDAKDQSAAEATARQQGGQVPWFRPTDWNGDVFNYDGMSAPFDRQVSNDGYVEAMTADPPGTTGDVVLTTTQIDYLAMMERAFRVRQTLRRPRATAHTISRKRGQGSDTGPLMQCGLEYVRSMLRQANTP